MAEMIERDDGCGSHFVEDGACVLCGVNVEVYPWKPGNCLMQGGHYYRSLGWGDGVRCVQCGTTHR